MRLRHQPHYASDGESLQADVMRFMAIIAFCLIAVLALVRDVQPPPDAPQPEPQPEAVAAPVTAEAEPLARAPEPPAKVKQPQAQPEPMAPAPRSTPVPPPEARQVRLADMAPKVEPAAVESTPDAKEAQTAAPEDKGLSLRFASDRDFLRLVTRGEIQVFAYQATSVLGLDRNFEFLSADSPGQVYELLPETIPSLIFAALDRATPESRSYTWGIRMPRKLEGKIRGYIDRDVRGELVIDRYGEVHHVAS